MHGKLICAALLLTVSVCSCGADGDPADRSDRLPADRSRSVVNGGESPSGVPPSREDAAVKGRIVQYESRLGAELDMQPEGMRIYIFEVHVIESSLPCLSHGDRLSIHSKLAPPKGWEGRELTMQVAAFAGGTSYWLTAFE